MATFPCTPAIGLAVCARLVKANIPFTLDVQSQHLAYVECKFQDTLEAAVMQVNNEHRRLPATHTLTETARLPKVGDSALVSVHPLLGVVDVVLVREVIEREADIQHGAVWPN